LNAHSDSVDFLNEKMYITVLAQRVLAHPSNSYFRCFALLFQSTTLKTLPFIIVFSNNRWFCKGKIWPKYFSSKLSSFF